MQFRDLNAQYKRLKNDIDQAIANVLESGQYIQGEPVKRLEKTLAKYVGVKHCITCANGTDALEIALMTMGLGKGDAVFVPDFTFFATAEAVASVGATPVFADVCEDTFNMSPESLETMIKKMLAETKLIPKAIIPVDLFGLPADYPNIKKIADKYNLLILEDGAQGFGGQIGEKKACSFGDIATTSFFPAKPLGCYGDGGAIFTDNDEWAKLVRSICVHGKGEDKYDNIRIGRNSRLDTIQGAILEVKFKTFTEYELEAVNKVAKGYTEMIDDRYKTPVIPTDFHSSFAQYTIQCKNEKERDMLKKRLADNGIPSMIYYSVPLHKQGAFASRGYATEDYSVTERLTKVVLSLPMGADIEEEGIQTITSII